MQPLASTLRYHFETRFFLARIHESVKTVYQKEGRLKAGAMVTAMSVSSLVGGALNYFCLEGCVRSIIEVVEDERYFVRIRYLGDVGGWASIAIFCTIAVKGIYERVMAEGEFIQLKQLCTDWCRANKNVIESIPELESQLYPKIYECISAFHARCAFSKTTLSRRLLAIDVCQDAEVATNTPQFVVDAELQQVYKSVQRELEIELGSKKFLKRCCMGQRNIQKKGCCASVTSRVFGIVFPIILLLNVGLSLVGEAGLGFELFALREQLTDVGHFGEWPTNAIEAFITAYFLFLWYALSEGDGAVTREIFVQKKEELMLEPMLQKRFAEVAKEEIAHQSAPSAYLRLPIDDELDDITQRLEDL